MTQAKLGSLLKGAATLVPLMGRFACRKSGGTDSPRYCYAVWLRHLIMAARNGLWSPRIKSVAELGPGDSIGIGLAAMLCGVDNYVGCDAKAYAYSHQNEKVLEGLLELFGRRAPVPDHSEFPDVRPILPAYEFPTNILNNELLANSLRAQRIQCIRQSLDLVRSRKQVNLPSPPVPPSAISIRYVAPWMQIPPSDRATVDWVFSQAVLEHVDNVADAYAAMWEWLKPGGFMSHTIDFKSHGLTHKWNGHWTLSKTTWRVVRGNRPYLINRLPHSTHLKFMRDSGFRIVGDLKDHAEPLPRLMLSLDTALFDEEDLSTSGSFVLALKPAS